MKFHRLAVFKFGLPYESDKKEKSYKVEVKETDGSTVVYTVPKICGKKGQLHCILEQWPAFDEMATARKLKGEQKFSIYSQKCLTGKYQTIFNNVKSSSFKTPELQNANGAFELARKNMITRTTKFKYPQDEHIDYLST